MNTEAGPSALPRLPSSTVTSKVSLLAFELGRVAARRTASVTAGAVLGEYRDRGVGRVLGEAAGRQISTISGVTMWPTLRTGRLVNRVARRRDAVEHQLARRPACAPRAFSTISACECCRAGGHADRLLGRRRDGVGRRRRRSASGRTARPGARIRAARRLHVCCAFIATGPSFPGRSQPRLYGRHGPEKGELAYPRPRRS